MTEGIQATAREESEESVVNHLVDDGSVEQTPGLPGSAGPSGPQPGGAGTKERVVTKPRGRRRSREQRIRRSAAPGNAVLRTPCSQRGSGVRSPKPAGKIILRRFAQDFAGRRPRTRAPSAGQASTAGDVARYGVRTLPDPADGLGCGWSRPSGDGRWRPSASAVGGRGAVSLVIQPELFAAGHRNLGENSLDSSLVSSTESLECAPRRDG